MSRARYLETTVTALPRSPRGKRITQLAPTEISTVNILSILLSSTYASPPCSHLSSSPSYIFQLSPQPLSRYFPIKYLVIKYFMRLQRVPIFRGGRIESLRPCQLLEKVPSVRLLIPIIILIYILVFVIKTKEN